MIIRGINMEIENRNGFVFGNGEHESTRVVLEMLYKVAPKDKKVLDIGTGTGIQSIFAKKLGAKEVVAVDIDVVSIKTARDNFKKNNLDIESRLNIYNEYLDFKADITVANLPPEYIREFLPMAKTTMSKDGVVIFSWFSHFKTEAELDLSNFEIVDHIAGTDWDAYTVKLK